MTYVVKPWIGGKAVDGKGGTVDIDNPATGEVIGTLELVSPEQVEEAIELADKAQKEWRNKSIPKHQEVMYKFRQLVMEDIDNMAQLSVDEHGKTLSDARGEIQRGLETVEYACNIGANSKGQYSYNVGTNVDLKVIRQPLGVVAGIVPFNFPAMVPMWMFPLALATGNAIVLKPANAVPSAAFDMAKKLKEAGLPDGLFSLLPGDNQITNVIIDNPAVQGVSFVGSTKVAKLVQKRAIEAGKRVQALGGANNHAMVMPDADQEFVAKWLAAAAFGAAGERCMALSVAVAVGEAGEGLAEAVKKQAGQIAIPGQGNDEKAGFGPVISKAAQERIISWIDEAEKLGAKVILDGRKHKVEGYEGGYWLGPTILEDVPLEAKAYCEEVFGPVLLIQHRDSFDEAIELMNRQTVGNGSAIFTNDGGVARRFEHEIEAGMVGINVPIPTPVAYHSFGGWKDSLNGEHHIHGPEGVEFYTRAKAITSRWPSEDEVHDATLSFEKED